MATSNFGDYCYMWPVLLTNCFPFLPLLSPAGVHLPNESTRQVTGGPLYSNKTPRKQEGSVGQASRHWPFCLLPRNNELIITRTVKNRWSLKKISTKSNWYMSGNKDWCDVSGWLIISISSVFTVSLLKSMAGIFVVYICSPLFKRGVDWLSFD